MNSIQSVKLLMFRVIKNYLSTSQAIVDHLPGYQENFIKLENNINAIEAEFGQQQKATKGASSLKKALRLALVNKAYDVSGKMVAYANNVHDIILSKEIKYTRSDLLRSPDVDLITKTTCIYKRSHALVDELGDYGITPEVNASLLSDINAFNEAIPITRDGLTNQKCSTAALVRLFRETDEALDNIDKIVQIIQLTEPVFYESYKEKRKLTDPRRRIVSLKGIVTDEVTGAGIKGVTLVITIDGSVIIKKSADKGGFKLKKLPSGMYTITATKNGYMKQEVTVVVNDGEMSVVEIVMVKG